MHHTPFALLGNHEKTAFIQGIKDVGSGLWDTVAGKYNAGRAKNWAGFNANMAGLGSMWDSGTQEVTNVANQSWNQDMQNANNETARANNGWNKATTNLSNAAGRVGNYFANIGRSIVAGDPEKFKPQVAPTQQPVNATPWKKPYQPTSRRPEGPVSTPAPAPAAPIKAANAMEKTAFAMLEKEANKPVALAGLAQRGLQWGSKFLRGSAGKSKVNAGKKVIEDLTGGQSLHKARQNMGTEDYAALRELAGQARGAAGNRRLAVSGQLSRASEGLANSSTAQNIINYGAGGLGVTGVGAGGYMLGNSRGNSKGYAEGLGNGVDAGIAHYANGMQNMDNRGFMDRVTDVFTGGPDQAEYRQRIMQDRDALIQSLIQNRHI